MTQRLFSRVVWSRAGLNRFEREVNHLLLEGFQLRQLEIICRWLCYVCIAVLEDENEDKEYKPPLED